MHKKILVAGNNKFCEEIKNVLGVLGIGMIFEQDLIKITLYLMQANWARRIILLSFISIVNLSDVLISFT